MLKYVRCIASILLVIGGLNWGLFAFLNTNLVSAIFGQSTLAQLTYGLIAASAIFEIFNWSKKQCS